MKYPQVVSMPTAVQDWLDEQLEARGIDAIVYTHYVLSLLQRDSLDLPDDLLVVSTKEVGRRGRKRGRNREEYWDVWDLDQLKRTAAVECLMSASDQKCGIEKLVDELCIKLKEIQSEGESSYCLELSEVPATNTTTSLQDQLQKYHAAFPPLNSKFADSCSSLINILETGSAWSGKVLVNSFGKNKLCNKITPSVEKLPVDKTDENKENNNSSWKEENMKSRSQIKDRAKAKKEVGYGFAWNMAGERNEMEETSSSESTRVFHYNRQNQVNNVEMETEWDSRRLYERQAEEVYSCPIKGLSTTNSSLGENADKQNVQLIAKYGVYSTSVDQAQDTISCSNSSQENTDDQNLAQLIAKFDHSIEALWNPEYSSASSDEFSSDENEQDLPVDFKQLLSSPSEQCLTVELFNLNSKRNPVNSSFIHCGTNITSSIWSEQPSNENSLDQDDYRMDYCHSEHCNSNEMQEKLSDCHVDDKFTFVLVGENKIVGNKLNLHEHVNKSDDKGYPSYLFRNPNEKCSNDKSNYAWNNYDNFPSFFSSLPWTVNNTFGEITQNSVNKGWPADYTPPDKVYNTNTGLNDSLNTLNHNKEDSSFTEVIPKQNSFGGLLLDYGEKKVELSCGHNCHLETKENATVKSAEKEEEDLLTSTKTHFRPIRIESMDSNRSTNNNVGCYADGTIFVIPTTLDEVAFKRSESGALYLESESEVKLKYMEYKEKEMYGNRRHCDDRPNHLKEIANEFIPKFRVRQNEKCCQTEEVEDMMPSDDEVHTKRSKTCSEFYFPDDDHFAESCVQDRLKYKSDSSSYLCYGESQTDDSVRPDSLDGMAPKQSFISSCKCDTGQHSQMWPKSSQAPGSSVWETNGNKNQSWYNIWRASPGAVDHMCECGASSQCQKSSQYCQLREELTVEGEQLMSDLSYMQHLYQDEHEDAKSPVEDMLLYDDSRQLFVKETKSEDDFQTSCDKKVAGLSSELEAEWKQIERPFNAKAIQKDRKRRHSASQRAHKYYTHCHDLADSSCLEGITLRPVTL